MILEIELIICQTLILKMTLIDYQSFFKKLANTFADSPITVVLLLFTVVST